MAKMPRTRFPKTIAEIEKRGLQKKNPLKGKYLVREDQPLPVDFSKTPIEPDPWQAKKEGTRPLSRWTGEEAGMRVARNVFKHMLGQGRGGYSKREVDRAVKKLFSPAHLAVIGTMEPDEAMRFMWSKVNLERQTNPAATLLFESLVTGPKRQVGPGQWDMDVASYDVAKQRFMEGRRAVPTVVRKPMAENLDEARERAIASIMEERIGKLKEGKGVKKLRGEATATRAEINRIRKILKEAGLNVGLLEGRDLSPEALRRVREYRMEHANLTQTKKWRKRKELYQRFAEEFPGTEHLKKLAKKPDPLRLLEAATQMVDEGEGGGLLGGLLEEAGVAAPELRVPTAAEWKSLNKKLSKINTKLGKYKRKIGPNPTEQEIQDYLVNNPWPMSMSEGKMAAHFVDPSSMVDIPQTELMYGQERRLLNPGEEAMSSGEIGPKALSLINELLTLGGRR